MRRQSLLSSSLASSLQDKLGPGLPTGDVSLSLLASRDGLLFIWSRRDGAILLVDPAADSITKIRLASSPRHTVENVVVNRAGTWLALSGPDGVTAVPIQKRLGLKKEEVVVSGLHLVDGDVQAVAWHPGSVGYSHLAVLTKDAWIRLYNVADGVGEVRGLALGAGGRVAVALGEVPVSMTFGPAGEAGQWPLFVLFGNCDVFCIAASINHEWTVEGPLEVVGVEEGEECKTEACAIVAIGGILCMATVGGAVQHYVVLGGEVTTLHMYERVELELGQLPSLADNSVFDCPLRLSGDPSGSSYLASHRAGLHKVDLPMVGLLRDNSPDLSSCGSTVEHLVCTRASPSLPPAPVLGCASAGPPSTILCLLANHSLTTRVLAQSVTQAPTLTDSVVVSDPTENSQHPDVEAQMRKILCRGGSQPLLQSAAGSDTRLQSAEALELLTGATATLRREYLARMHIAREELVLAATRLRERKAGQVKSLTSLEEDRGELRDGAEALSERYEDVKDKGDELRLRVESVLAKLQARVPHLSDKELAMGREVAGLERRVEALEGGIKQLVEKEKYQRCQVEASSVGRKELNKGQLDNFKQVLQADSRSIASLVQKINAAKKELGM